MPIHTPAGYLDITNATLRASEITTTSKVGIANSAPTHTLSVGNKLFVDDNAANVLTVSGNLVATSLKIGHIDLAPSYGLEHVANVINTISNVVQFTNTTTGFVSVSNVGIGTTTSPAGLLDVVGAFRMRYQDMGLTKTHIISGANTTSLNEDAGTYTYTRGAATTTGYFLPNPANITPKVGQRYRVKLTARSDYAGTIRYECPTSTIVTTYDLTTSFKEYTWDFNAEGATMQFAVTTALGSTSQFNAFSIERLGVGFNVNPTSTTAPIQFSGVTHFSDNVDIGTDVPLSTLQVGDGTAPTTGDATGSISLFGTGATKSNGNRPGLYHRSGVGLGLWSDAHMSFEVNGYNGNQTEAMRISAFGDVAIGTASPVAKLDVEYAQGTLSSYNYSTTSTWHGKGLRLAGGSNHGGFLYGHDINHSIFLRQSPFSTNDHNAYCNVGYHAFYTGGHIQNQTERLRITSDGEVGIGTYVPRATLHVANQVGPSYTSISGNDRFRIEEEATNGNRYGLQMGIDTSTGNSVLQTYFLYTNGSYAAPGGSGAHNLVLQQHGGYVGIGTDRPWSALHVTGSLNAGYNMNSVIGIQMGVLSSAYTGIELTGGSGNSSWIDFKNTSGNSDYTDRIRGGIGNLEFYTNNGERMRINSSGNVGIGTVTPHCPLHVHGSDGSIGQQYYNYFKYSTGAPIAYHLSLIHI